MHASAAELCITAGKERFSARLKRLTSVERFEAGVLLGRSVAGMITGFDGVKEEEEEEEEEEEDCC